MFKVGDKVRDARVETVQSISKTGKWLTCESGSMLWAANYELVEPIITATHLRNVCEQLRSVAGPQGRFWIREVFEKATGEKME